MIKNLLKLKDFTNFFKPKDFISYVIMTFEIHVRECKFTISIKVPELKRSIQIIFSKNDCEFVSRLIKKIYVLDSLEN